ncbi:MAG TPA: hypothetical protein VF043_09580 [Ktedonobacteraceae bacterium]
MSRTIEDLRAESQQDDPTEEQKKQNVINALALGWSLVELLGRCFTLKLPTPEKELEKDWDGERMIMISPAFNSQKRLKALVCFIRSIAEKLDLTDKKNDTDICTLDTLVKYVETLYGLEACDDPRRKEFLGKINQGLFLWDIKIRERLQTKSGQFRNNYDYVNAYMVGKGFAALRWYHEVLSGKQDGIKRIPGEILQHSAQALNRAKAAMGGDSRDRKPPESNTNRQGITDSMSLATSVDEKFLAMLEERVQLLAPYLDKFAPLALATSIEYWRDSILKQKIYDSSKEVSPELQRQADIWYDLLTAQRDPITYVTPSHVTWRYTLKVIRFSLPYIIVGIFLALGITGLIAFLIGHFWPPIAQSLNASTTVISTTTAVGTGFSLLAGIGTAIPTVKALWQWVTQRAQAGARPGAERVLGDAGKSLIDVFWESAQQEAINKATCVNHSGNLGIPWLMPNFGEKVN